MTTTHATRAKILLALLAIPLALGLAACGGGKPAASTAVRSTIAPTTAPPTTITPKVVNAKLNADAQQVVLSIATVRTAIANAVAGAGTSNETEAALLLDREAIASHQSHDDIANLKDAMSLDGGDSAVALVNASNDLKNSMGTLSAYADYSSAGYSNPATLAHYTTQFATASSEWNLAVGSLYDRSAQTPPLL